MPGEQPLFYLPKLLQIIHGLAGQHVIAQLLMHTWVSSEEKDHFCAGWEMSWGNWTQTETKKRCRQSHLALRVPNAYL